MKRLLPFMVIASIFFSSCSGENKSVEPTVSPTVAFSETPTFTPAPTSTPTLIPTATPTSTLSPDTMIYQFDSNVSEEDRALIKEGVQIARHYLINNFGSDIKGSYVIQVKNYATSENSTDNARVNGEGSNQVMTINVGHHWWTEENAARRIKVVVHETTHFWQSEQGNGWPSCKFLRGAVGLPGSFDPRTEVLQEGHAEYVGYMAAGLEEDAFEFTDENLIPILSPVSRDLTIEYSVMKAGVYWLIKEKGPMAFSKYCSEVGNGKTFPDAFESGFGMTFEKFTEGFKQSLLDGLSKLCSQNSACDKEKLATVWQAQEGCFAFKVDSLHLPIDFLTKGYPRYIVAIADGNENEVDPDLALGVWQANQWNEKIWFVDNVVAPIAFKNLFEAKDMESFTKYCEAIAQDAYPQDAFKSAFGLSVQEFRTQFKQEVLGEMADCTVAKCGGGVDNYSDIYKLGHLLDPKQAAPNLIVHFVDQANKPVIMTHVSMLKQNVGTTGEYAQPFIVPGTFSEAMQPGRYSFFFCEPGYPVDFADNKCQYHETDWFDVFQSQVTELTFQIPLPIENPNLTQPNLSVKFFDEDGSLVPNLILQICSYENPVKICSNEFLFAKTDSNGVYSASLRDGKYLIRIPASPDYEVPFYYQMLDITLAENTLTELQYHFPVPNLIIKFTDVNGSFIPSHEFVLCKIINNLGDCSSQVKNQGEWLSTNKQGAFSGYVSPGQYYVLTCKLYCIGWSGNVFDLKFENIIVTGETEVTTVEYPLYK